ncbi:MAG TPA: metallophosphoesterase [Humidesulfovibrio sp.]|uniref:metallophosphoesterase n=1 Tax=Humidesulfovibrio sp. TaxID=2910988 RepID=UPI002C4CE25A|nr:metallophosphoesterase [Humidesulfovibrio sp.]HWR03959.1 metallophosphoesterase [Humidesulfovibrio sp.]
MRFYLIFTVIFMFMLLVVLLQIRRQAGLSRRRFTLTLLGGLALSLFLASTRFMPETWPMAVARPAWWIGYGAFGLVAYMFLFQVTLLVAETGARLALPRQAPVLRSRRAMLAVTAMAVATVAWGVREAGNLRVLSRRMVSPKLLRPVRVAVVTDLHLGALTIPSRLRDLVALVRAQRPDVVVLVGDMVNDHPDALEPYAAILRDMRPELGMYGVFGNHERYEGDAKSARVFQWIGAELLRNRTAVLPGTGVQLLGVDDPGRSGGAREEIAQEIRSVAQASDPNLFRILLNHRPEAWREAAQPLGIELMLSGHTHRGQLYPFYLVVRLFNEFMGGFYEENGQVLGVSAGAGFWGPPMRVLAPPDILVLDLVPENGPGAG